MPAPRRFRARDIWIAGFGDYEIAGISVPSLTTINPFPREIGTRTAAMILDLLDARTPVAGIIPITPQLIIRNSTR